MVDWANMYSDDVRRNDPVAGVSFVKRFLYE